MFAHLDRSDPEPTKGGDPNVDSGIIGRNLPEHLLDRIVQEEADRLQEERGFFDPDVLEKRVARRVVNMSEADLGALREKSARDRISRRVARRVRGRVGERFRRKS
jgi:hypothetical protein